MTLKLSIRCDDSTVREIEKNNDIEQTFKPQVVTKRYIIYKCFKNMIPSVTFFARNVTNPQSSVFWYFFFYFLLRSLFGAMMRGLKDLWCFEIILGSLSCFIQSPSWKYCTLDFRSQKFSRSAWINYTRLAPSLLQMNKGNIFIYLFPQSFPAQEKESHVGTQLKIGLSTAENSQAQFHYQSKLSSDVEPVCFLRTKNARYFFSL